MTKLSDAFAAERARRGFPPADPDTEARYAFASTVMAVRRAAGMNQRRLSEMTGVPQAEISRIERGLTVPTVTRANRLLRPLGYKLGAMPIRVEEASEERELVGASR